MTSPIAEIDVQEAARLTGAGEVLLLDVREHDEWAAGRAPGAVHLALGAVRPAMVPTDRPVLAICRSGHRSGRAATVLAATGIDVRNVSGGMQAWAAAGLPVVAGGDRPGTVA